MIAPTKMHYMYTKRNLPSSRWFLQLLLVATLVIVLVSLSEAVVVQHGEFRNKQADGSLADPRDRQGKTTVRVHVRRRSRRSLAGDRAKRNDVFEPSYVRGRPRPPSSQRAPLTKKKSINVKRKRKLLKRKMKKFLRRAGAPKKQVYSYLLGSSRVYVDGDIATDGSSYTVMGLFKMILRVLKYDPDDEFAIPTILKIRYNKSYGYPSRVYIKFTMSSTRPNVNLRAKELRMGDSIAKIQTFSAGVRNGLATSTRYWDCSGGACGCAYIPKGKDQSEPAHCYSNALFVAPEGNPYGARFYGTAAVSQALAKTTRNGCDRTCWKITGTGMNGVVSTLVVRHANYCPPENPACSNNNTHFDIAAPGFDVPEYSLSNTCSEREPDESRGFRACSQWMITSQDPGENCDCSQFINPILKAGCENFLSLQWDNPKVEFELLDSCPDEMVTECSFSYSPAGEMLATCASPTPLLSPEPTTKPTALPTPIECRKSIIDTTYLYEDNVPPKPSSPIALSDTPQFFSLGFDDNGYSGLDGTIGGLEWVLDMLGNKSQKNGNARASFYFTSVYSSTWTYESSAYVKRAWHKAMISGQEIGLHSHTHPSGSYFSTEQWEGEIQQCIDELIKPFDPTEVPFAPNNTAGMGANKSFLRGWRSPYLAYNDALYPVLKKKGIWYDTSIEEGWQMDQNGTNYLWPYTLDSGSPGNEILVSWGTKQALSNHSGLWEMPLYPLIVPPDNVLEEEKYGINPGLRTKIKSLAPWFDETSGKITGMDYNLWSQFEMTGPEFAATVIYSLDLRLQGNRAPFMLGVHSDYYSDKYTQFPSSTAAERRSALEKVVDYALSLPEVHILPIGEVLDWMRDPVPKHCLF